MTPRLLLQQITQSLQFSSLVANPAREAEWLILHVLQMTPIEFWQHDICLLTPAHKSVLDALVQKRLQGEPLQYLLGTQSFYGLTFFVDQSVLIPRPETEGLVELTLEKIKQEGLLKHVLPSEPLRILDVGAGSGAIALTLAHLLSEAQVCALEPSTAAFATLQKNYEHFKKQKIITQEQVQLLQYTWEQWLALQTTPTLWDVVVSNPPYIDEADAHLLPSEVLQYEPHQALFSADHGNYLSKAIITGLNNQIKPAGFAILELNEKNADQLALFAQTQGFISVVCNDLTGRARYLYLTRK